MNRHAYIMMFDTDDSLDYNEIHKGITSMQGLYSWFHYLRSSYILISDKDSNELTQQIIKVIPNKRFLLFMCDLNTRNGWMPREAWDWIEKKSHEVE